MSVLYPEARAAVDAAAGDTPVWTDGYDVVAARAANRAAALQEPPEDVAEVADLDADGVRVRLFRPAEAEPGLLVHLHGGGFVFHDVDVHDRPCRRLANRLGRAVLSVDYRLAPEHPFPAGPDDCEAAALWLVEHAAEEFGTEHLVVGGESAGAYLSILTMLRLRDRLGETPPFLGVDLCYGGYDMSGTPSTELYVGKVPYAQASKAQRAMYLPDRDLAALRDPAVSPMWAELHDLPPCLLTVGTADWLLDESILLAGRLAAAGNDVELAVYPEGPHGIESMPTALGRAARQRIYDFLGSKLDAAP